MQLECVCLQDAATVRGEALRRSIVMEGRGGMMVPPVSYPPELVDLEKEDLQLHPYRKPDWQEQLKQRWQAPKSSPLKAEQDQKQLQSLQQQQEEEAKRPSPSNTPLLPPAPVLPPQLPGGGLAGVMGAEVMGWELGACAAAQGDKGYAGLCGAVALSDKAGKDVLGRIQRL